MTTPAKHAHHLSVEIGPRPPASAAEARTARYCAEVLEEAGLVSGMEPFRGLGSFGHLYIPTTAGSLAAALLGLRRRAARVTGLALAAGSVAAFVGEQTKRVRPLTGLAARRASQNVVARLRASEEARRTLVIVAHVDSSRSGVMFHPKVAKDFHRNSLIGLGAAVATIFGWLLPRPLRRLLCLAATAILGNSLFALIQREVWGIDVAGANDNASGAGVMLALAETLAAEPLVHTDLVFVATGCEESDLIGMSAFMDLHEDELRDAWFLNIDTVGGPGTTIRWVTSSTMLEPLRADEHLIRLAEEVAEAHPELGAEPGTWHVGLDTDVAGVRGLKQMSIVALTAGGTLPDWHWPTDTFDNLDESVLERAYAFTLDLVRRFDSYS